jgi:hypothetical protein
LSARGWVSVRGRGESENGSIKKKDSVGGEG